MHSGATSSNQTQARKVFPMSDGASERGTVTCPICGATAEAGCIYGRHSWFRLRWQAGAPSFAGNLLTSVGGGDPVGGNNVFCGPHAPGIRCTSCRRIILDL
jgi:hypothetical protein